LTYIAAQMQGDPILSNAARAKSAQAVAHRLQIGIGGVVMVLVTVALADMMLAGASNEQAVDAAATAQPGIVEAPVESAPAPAVPNSEPLVDLGVVPDLPDKQAAAPVQQAAPGATVPDLPAAQVPGPAKPQQQNP